MSFEMGRKTGTGRARRSALAASCLLLICQGVASAQNLLANGGFATGVGEWGELSTYAGLAWNPADVASQPGSGSAEVSNSRDSASFQAQTGAAQCVAVTGGAPYALEGFLFIPGGQTSGGYAAIAVFWYADATCGSWIPGGPNPQWQSVTSVGNQNRWIEQRIASTTAPQGARSAAVALWTSKDQPDGKPIRALFDNLSFAAVGPNISVSGPSAGSLSQQLTFTATAQRCSPTTDGWRWTLDGGAALGSVTRSSITAKWGAAGNKVVTASNVACGSAQGTKTVTISPEPARQTPVVFVHGFCSNSAAWSQMIANLKSLNPQRYPGDPVDLYFDGSQVRVRGSGTIQGSTLFLVSLFSRTAPEGHGLDPLHIRDVPIAEHGHQLRKIVDEIVTSTGSPTVDIVGHSMGGLVARAYVEGLAAPADSNPPTYRIDSVRHIVTVGTPHLGAFLSEVSFNGSPLKTCQAEESRNKSELIPNSVFLRKLNSKPIPATATLTAIGSRLLSDPLGLEGNSDGVVRFESQTLIGLLPQYYCATNVEALRNLLDIDPPLARWEIHNLALDLVQTATWVDTRLSLSTLAPRRILPLPVAGDWNGDKVDTVGVYDPVAHRFYLRDSNTAGPPDRVVTVPGDRGGCRWPVVGDWDGDGRDTVGVYDPVNRVFSLVGSPRGQYGGFGPPNTFPESSGWLPLAGDWDGNGNSSVGFFDPVSVDVFYKDVLSEGSQGYKTFVRLHSNNRQGFRETRITLGAWNAKSPRQFHALYYPLKGGFQLWYTNSNSGPASTKEIALGSKNSTWLPVAGNWDGKGAAGIGLYDPSSSTFHLREVTNPSVMSFTFDPGAH